MQAKKTFRLDIAAILAAASLAACGGGGGGGSEAPTDQTPPPPSVDGFYAGKSNGRDVAAVVLDDGRIYAMYTTVGADTLGGVIIARGTASNGAYSSTVMKDFSVETGQTATGSITGTYVGKQSFNGTVSYSTPGFVAGSFTGTYSKAYEGTPSLALVAGTYTGGGLASDGTELDIGVLTITSTGTISSPATATANCATTGTIQPRAKGNLYDVSFTSTGPDCVFPGVTLSGIALYDANSKSIVAMAHTADLGQGILVAGTQE